MSNMNGRRPKERLTTPFLVDSLVIFRRGHGSGFFPLVNMGGRRRGTESDKRWAHSSPRYDRTGMTREGRRNPEACVRVT